MAEDKYFGIAPENAADAEKQRAKQKRRKAMIENMLKDEEDGYDEFDAALEAIKRIERNLEIIKGCLWTSRYMDDDDDRPYGYDGPMPWDEEEEDDAPTKDDCGECALLFPIPCTKDETMKTAKDAFAKVDEEVTEWKAAVVDYIRLTTTLESFDKLGKEAKLRVSEEGADIMTAITTAEERMGINVDARSDAQLHVNQHNKERGRW